MKWPLLLMIAGAAALALALVFAIRDQRIPAILEPAGVPESGEREFPTSLVEVEERAIDPGTHGDDPQSSRVAQTSPPAVPRIVTLAFRVLDDRTGGPVAGATVLFTEHEDTKRPKLGRSGHHGELRGATRFLETGPSGEFSVAGVEPGRWSAAIEAPWRVAQQEAGTVERGVVPGEKLIRLSTRPIYVLRLVDEAGERLSTALERRGVVIPSDVVLVESGRTLGDERSLQEGRRARAIGPLTRIRNGLEGVWGEPSEIAAGRSTWFAGRPDPDPFDTPWILPEVLPSFIALCSGPRVLGEVRVDEETRVVELSVVLGRVPGEPSSVRFRVVAADTGLPLAAARAGLLPPGKFATAAHTPDPDGIVRIEGWHPGPRWLTVLAPGYQWLQREIVVPEEPAQVDLGTFELARSTRIRGRVLGTGCGGDVLTFPLARFEETRHLRRAFPASPRRPGGDFEIVGLGREPHLLRLASRDAAALPVVVDTSDGDVDGVELVCERGTEVRFELGEPRADGVLRVETDEGLPVFEHEVAGAPRELAARLVPGDYRWRLESEEAVVSRGTLRIDAADVAVHVARAGR